MEKTLTIEDFYQHKLNWMPENISKEIGHFNVFRLDDFSGPAQNLSRTAAKIILR